ncbi:hypothetical protein PLICRDRAFT_151657 [Plicaturopsis crispa FD-325 SS-3]|nr:hypothetical protein PLICRDRAFT_151657 [Plicaturopsis crispa FD-325 SS-3]
MKKIVLTSRFFGRVNSTTLPFATLVPLFSFPHLTDLELRLDHPLHLEDADLEKMARAWPALESVLIHSPTFWTGPSHLTLRGLANFINLAPGLRHLALYVDATTTANYSRSVHAAANDTITSITLGNSPIRDPVAVAAIFSGILPNLREIRYGSDEERQARWHEVEKSLRIFAAVREEERQRCLMVHGLSV